MGALLRGLVQTRRGRPQTGAANAVGRAGGQAVQPSWGTRRPRWPCNRGRQGREPLGSGDGLGLNPPRTGFNDLA